MTLKTPTRKMNERYRIDKHHARGMIRTSIIEQGKSYCDGFVAGKWCDNEREAEAFIERKLMELGAQTRFVVGAS